MDRTGIIVISICALLLGVWYFETQKYDKYLAQQQALNTNVVTAAAAPAATSGEVPAPAPTGLAISTNTPERLLTLTNVFRNVSGLTNSVRYTFTSRGGGIKSIGLLNYPETIAPWWSTNRDTNAIATLNTGAPVPIMAILGDPDIVGDGDFTLTKIDNVTVQAEKSLPSGVVLTKNFHLKDDYLVDVTVTLRNETGKPLPLAAEDWVLGTATPMGVDDINFQSYGGMMWCNGETYYPNTPIYFSTNTSVLGFWPRTPKTVFTAGNNNVVWGGAYNQFFVILGMPKVAEPAENFSARPVNLPGTNYVTSAAQVGVQAALVYPAQTLAASQVFQRQITLYAGPKEFRALEKIGADLQNRADLAMNFGTGYAGFWGIGSFFAKVLLVVMNTLHDWMPWLSYGWIIVLITVSLRVIFWPITMRSIRSMKKMQALSPQVAALKEKYADDPAKLMQKQQELWRENGVSPMSGCWPALIQTPVFLGFFTMVRSAIELRGSHFLWMSDLTKTDTIFVIPGVTFIPFFSTPHGLPFNLLPLLMVGVMVWQAHMQPPSPGMDPASQKMMRYLPLMFLLFFYNYSAGMALYFTVSTLLGILQTRMTRNIKVTPAVSPLTPVQKKKK